MPNLLPSEAKDLCDRSQGPEWGSDWWALVAPLDSSMRHSLLIELKYCVEI